MATKTLIEPTPAAKLLKAKTPFDEQASGKPGWLSCSLWSSPLSYPNRARCQSVVLDHERAEGEKLVADYRESEKLSADNDLGVRQAALRNSELNSFKRLAPVAHQRILNEIQNCDHQQYLVAEATLRELRESAADLSKVILGRLVKSFDAELQETAVEAEERLQACGIPLSNPSGDDFELWHNPETLARHCWRECCRHALEGIGSENSIGCVQWLATSEQGVPQPAWL